MYLCFHVQWEVLVSGILSMSFYCVLCHSFCVVICTIFVLKCCAPFWRPCWTPPPPPKKPCYDWGLMYSLRKLTLYHKITDAKSSCSGHFTPKFKVALCLWTSLSATNHTWAVVCHEIRPSSKSLPAHPIWSPFSHNELFYNLFIWNLIKYPKNQDSVMDFVYCLLPSCVWAVICCNSCVIGLWHKNSLKKEGSVVADWILVMSVATSLRFVMDFLSFFLPPPPPLPGECMDITGNKTQWTFCIFTDSSWDHLTAFSALWYLQLKLRFFSWVLAGKRTHRNSSTVC
jgi:hypothetical protein